MAGKNFQNNQNLTLKKMFNISTKVVSEQDEISNLETIRWENYSWKYLSLIVDERVERKSTSFQILYCVLERSINIQMPTNLGKTG